MSILEYYFELLEKPKYMLSTSEQTFVDLFPLIAILAITAVILIICCVVEIIKNHR